MEADPSDVIRSPGPWPERAGYDPAAQMTVNPAEYVTELFRAHHLELVRLAVLIVAFRRLPARQREVLALRYYVDMSVADAAATLHISEGAVRSTASRGLDALARILPSRSSKEA